MVGGFLWCFNPQCYQLYFFPMLWLCFFAHFDMSCVHAEWVLWVLVVLFHSLMWISVSSFCFNWCWIPMEFLNKGSLRSASWPGFVWCDVSDSPEEVMWVATRHRAFSLVVSHLQRAVPQKCASCLVYFLFGVKWIKWYFPFVEFPTVFYLQLFYSSSHFWLFIFFQALVNCKDAQTPAIFHLPSRLLIANRVQPEI